MKRFLLTVPRTLIALVAISVSCPTCQPGPGAPSHVKQLVFEKSDFTKVIAVRFPREASNIDEPWRTFLHNKGYITLEQINSVCHYFFWESKS